MTRGVRFVDLEDCSKEELLTIIYSAYQAVGAIAEETGLLDNEDIIRLQDVLAYGRTEDGIDLLSFPKAPLVRKDVAE